MVSTTLGSNVPDGFFGLWWAAENFVCLKYGTRFSEFGGGVFPQDHQSVHMDGGNVRFFDMGPDPQKKGGLPKARIIGDFGRSLFKCTRKGATTPYPISDLPNNPINE